MEPDGRDVGGDVSGDEAAWRDLIARYELPTTDTAVVPWPEREDLPREPSQQVTETAPAPDPSAGQDAGDQDSAGTVDVPGDPASGAPVAGAPGTGAPGTGAPGTGAPGLGSAAGDKRDPGPGTDRTRVVRRANPTSRSSADDDDDDDNRYIPPPPPPLPKLDSVGKGAWTAAFGGPGYLLLATMLGWSVSGVIALLAIAAFIGGFAVLVVRMGDGPSRGDGPDNGAVV